MGNSLTAQNSVTTTRTQTDKLDAATRSPDPPPATERRARRQCTTTHAPAIRTTRTTRASRKHALTPAASTVPAAVDSCWKPPRRAVDDVNTDPRRSFDLAVGLLRADTKRTQRPRPSAKTPSQSRRRCNGGETWELACLALGWSAGGGESSGGDAGAGVVIRSHSSVRPGFVERQIHQNTRLVVSSTGLSA